MLNYALQIQYISQSGLGIIRYQLHWQQ